MKTKIQGKLIKFFVLASMLIPLFSSAAFIPPIANITVVVQTQGVDSSFHFDLKTQSGQDPTFYDYDQFDIQTQNLSGSYFYPYGLVAFSGENYLLQQTNIPGLEIKNILCLSDNPNDVFRYQKDSVMFQPIKGENITCTFNNAKIQGKTPVLFIPGILGTEISDNNSNKLWLNLGRIITDINGDQFMDPLQFNADLTPSDTSLVLDNVIGKIVTYVGNFDYSDGLFADLKSQNYTEGKDLFTFPYDWRYGISGKFSDDKTNVDLFKQKIADIMQQTGSDKVDVVAHSMGGLVVKKYVMDNPTSSHIGKAVFVAVPNTGSPKAVKVLLQGDSFNIWGLNDQEVKKIAPNMPGIYDLLPDQEYYNQNGSFVKIGDYTNIVYPVIKNLNYQDFKSYLTQDNNFNSQALTESENLHTQAYDNFDMRTAGIDVYNIVGCKKATLEKIIDTKNTSQPFIPQYITTEITPGDGTVPTLSAINLPANQSNVYYSLSADHGKMPSQYGIRQEIVNLISGSNLDTGKDLFGVGLITQNINDCILSGDFLNVLSPVNLTVTDQFGNKLGLADDGSIINEIPNADFEIFGDHKFIYLPTDEGQVYAISMQGAGSGTYTIKNQEIQNSQVVKTEVFSNLPVTESLTGSVNISSGGTTTLTITPAEGEQPITITPSATIGAEASADILPPISAATIAGSQGQPNFYNSDVLINITAQDNNSGILDIEYNLDNMGSQKVQSATASIPVATEGSHTITFFATDKAGNNEQPKTISFTIDKTAPEVAIQFDPAIKDLKFTPQDVTQTTIQDQDDTITITDQAGNTTQIKLKDKNRKVAMKAEIKEIRYNNILADTSKNSMAFAWLSDKSKSLKLLSQYAKSTKDYSILAVYDGKNTTLVGKDQTGKIFKTEKGLKLIKITTNKGALGWSW